MSKKRYFGRPRNSFTDAVLLNDETYMDYLLRLKRIATSMFEWTLPPSMDARFLERCLYYTGQASLLYDDSYGFINTKSCSAGYLNIYGLPTKLNCFSYEYQQYRDVYSGLGVGENNDLKSTSAILVKNNNDLCPTCGSIELFAYRLARAERTADINIFTARNPYIIMTDNRQLNTMKTLFTQVDDNTPLIYADKNTLDLDNIKTLNLKTELIVKDIKDYQRTIWNEALTFLGVNNLDEKRERVISQEIDSNNELINLNLQSYLAPRKLACEQFNALFPDQKIDVKVRSDLHNVIKEAESIISEYKDVKDKEQDNG